MKEFLQIIESKVEKDPKIPGATDELRFVSELLLALEKEVLVVGHFYFLLWNSSKKTFRLFWDSYDDFPKLDYND